jgi:hypothetical protein
MNKKTIPKRLREKTYSKYNGTSYHSECYTGCGKIITPFEFEAGHVISEFNGGKTEIENLRPICSDCNKSMGTMSMHDYVEKCNFKSKLSSDGSNSTIIDKINEGPNAVAQLYCKSKKNDIKVSYQTHKIIIVYVWNNNVKVWEKRHNDYLMNDIADWISKELKDLMKDNMDNENHKSIKEYALKMKKYTDIKYVSDVFKFCKSTLNDEAFFKKLDTDTKVINFKNGLYDLQKNLFRERTKEDCVSETLDYNYEESNSVLINELEKIIYEISNNDDEILKQYLNFLGYCLTGEMSDDKLLYITGNVSENDKSLIGIMYKLALPIYFKEINKEAIFAKNKNDVLKKSIRFTMVTDFEQTKLHISQLKKVYRRY